MTKHRRKMQFFFNLCVLTFIVSFGLWIFSRAIWPDATGLSVGLRRLDGMSSNDFMHVICGIHSGDRDLWYFKYIIPSGINNADRLSCSSTILGFHVTAYFPNGRDWYYALGAPFWFLIPMSLIGTVWSYWRLRKKDVAGLCPVCGYDLRASNDRCPECGTLFTASIQTPTAPPRETGDKS
jgi:hypothetical protein